MKELNNDTFVETVEDGQGLFLVDFWGSGCGSCKMLLKQLEPLTQEMPNVTFVKVNIDEAYDVANTHGVTSLPTMMLFKDGQKVGSIVGMKNKEQIKQWITQLS